MADVDRLPPSVLHHEMVRVPPQERQLAEAGEPAAQERLLRALFWTLVYHLEPARWDELARIEPIHPDLIEALPRGAALALDVGAGSGRLTQFLAQRSRSVIAVEPSDGLRSILARRLPAVDVVSAWAERLPLPDRHVQLTAACGAFGPDPAVVAELQRVTASGGCIALINPEEPRWFESHGWSLIHVDPLRPLPHAPWIDEFFGPPDPPGEMVMLRTA